MHDWFSDEEKERMARFASSTAYTRDPTMLLPNDDEEEEE